MSFLAILPISLVLDAMKANHAQTSLDANMQRTEIEPFDPVVEYPYLEPHKSHAPSASCLIYIITTLINITKLRPASYKTVQLDRSSLLYLVSAHISLRLLSCHLQLTLY
jgi:hypothetical protein